MLVEPAMVENLCLSWWLEVGPVNPPYINYYRPFENQDQAEAAKQEYGEKSKKFPQIIYSYSKLCHPRQRTIKEKELTIQDLEACPPKFLKPC